MSLPVVSCNKRWCSINSSKGGERLPGPGEDGCSRKAKARLVRGRCSGGRAQRRRRQPCLDTYLGRMWALIAPPHRVQERVPPTTISSGDLGEVLLTLECKRRWRISFSFFLFFSNLQQGQQTVAMILFGLPPLWIAFNCLLVPRSVGVFACRPCGFCSFRNEPFSPFASEL